MAIEPEDERHPHERELEEPEPSDARVACGVGDDHVDRRAGEREHRSGVRAERERQQQLGRRPAEPHRHHHDDRHERRDRPVDVDQRRQEGNQRHGQDDQPGPALTGRRDQPLKSCDYRHQWR